RPLHDGPRQLVGWLQRIQQHRAAHPRAKSDSPQAVRDGTDRLGCLQVRGDGVRRLQLVAVCVRHRHQGVRAMVATIAPALMTMAKPTATRSAASFRKRTAPCSHGIIVSVSPMPMMTAVAIARAGNAASADRLVNNAVMAAPILLLFPRVSLIPVHVVSR